MAPYRERHRAIRWLPAASWHLTLLFLGSVSVHRLEELVAIVDDAALSSLPFRVEVTGGGGRERHGQAVAWLPVGEGAGRVLGLADHLAMACPADLPVSGPPRRTPSAHLTVARSADRAVLDDLTAERWGRPEERWRVDRLVLVRSHLQPSGARYETLHEAALYAAGE